MPWSVESDGTNPQPVQEGYSQPLLSFHSVGDSRCVLRDSWISEDFHNPTRCDAPVVARFYHSNELALKSQKPTYPDLDGFKLIRGNSADLVTRGLRAFLQSKHFLNSRDIEAEVPGMPDECQTSYVLGSVKPASAFRAGRLWGEVDPLVVADCFNIDACPL